MSDYTMTFTEEELGELRRILEIDLKNTLVELRRSTPNSEFKHIVQRRVDVMSRMLEAVKVELHSTAV